MGISENYTHLDLSRAYKEKKEYGLAIQELESALSHNPEDAQVHFELGKIYREMGGYDKAKEEFKKSQALGLTSEEVYIELSLLYQKNSEYELALQELKTALVYHPSCAYIYLGMARVYREKGDYNAALAQLKQVVGLDAGNKESYIELSWVYQEKGEFDLATQALKCALALEEQDADIHFELAKVYQKKKDYDLALGELERTIALIPDKAEAHIDMGLIYRQKEEYDRSAREFKEALRIGLRKDDPFFNNKMLNEIEFSQKETVLKSKPLWLWVNLTTKCNLRCIMCDLWKKPWDLPEKTAQEIAEFFPYLERVCWRGGEAFLSDRFEGLFDRAATYSNLKQSINTNGILLNEKWAKKLAQANVGLIVSVDGINQKTYEHIRGKGTFKVLLNNLDMVHKYKSKNISKMDCTLNFVVMKSNYREMEGAVDFAYCHGFDFLHFLPLKRLAEPENIFNQDDREALEYIRLIMPEIRNKAKGFGIAVDSELPIDEDSRLKPQPVSTPGKKREPDFRGYRCPVIKNQGVFCEFPWKQLFINWVGAVTPDCNCIKEVGNIYQSTLEEIWNSQRMQAYRGKILNNDFMSLCFHIHDREEPGFELINTYLPQRKYDLLIEELIKYLKFNPQNLSARLLLAKVYKIQGEFALAIDEIKKILCEYPENETARYELGSVYRKMKDYAAAMREFKKALLLGLDNDAVHFELGWTYREIKEYTLALEELSIASKLNPANSWIHFELGRAYCGSKDFNSAIKEFEQARQFGLDNYEVYLELCRAHRGNAQYSTALEKLETALQYDSSCGKIYLEMARVYQEIKDYDSAVRAYKKALELGFDNADIHIGLSTIYLEKKDYPLALNELKAALLADPDDGYIHLELGRLYRETKDYDSAIQEFHQAINLGLDNGEVHRELSRAYEKKKEYALALKELKIVLEAIPNDGSVRQELGLICREMKEYDRAIEELSQAIKLGSDNHEAHLELGRAYIGKLDYVSALKELKIALAANPSDGHIHLELGRLYRETKDYDSAIQEFHKAINLGLDNDDVHCELGKVYLEEDKYDFALEEFEACLKLNPGNAQINFERALVYKRKNDYTLTIKELKEAVSKGMDNGGVHIELSEAYRRMNEYGRAEEECLVALRLNPQNGWPNAELAWIYEEKGEYKSAAEQLKAALGKGLSGNSILKGLTRINRKQRVIQEFEEFMDSDNNDAGAVPGTIIEYIFQEGYRGYIKRIEEIARARPENLSTHIELAWIYYWHKQYGLAINELEKMSEIKPHYKGILKELTKLNIQSLHEKVKILYKFNKTDFRLTKEIISTLRSLFPERGEEIGALVKDLSKVYRLHDWRYCAMSKTEGAILYIITRLLKPQVIVEAGTWMGTSTAYLAKGCYDNRMGKVITVDIKEETGIGIPEELLPYITFYKKTDIQAALPKICRENEKIDMFFHDSVNDYGLLAWEIGQILPVFNQEGIIVIHDVLNQDDHPGHDVVRYFKEAKEKVKCHLFETDKGVGVIRDTDLYRLKNG